MELSLDETKEWLQTHEAALPTDDEVASIRASGVSGEVDCPLFKTHSVIQEGLGLLLDSTHAASIYLATRYKEHPRALTGAEVFPSAAQDFFVNAQTKPWRHGLQADEDGDGSEIESEAETETETETEASDDIEALSDIDEGIDMTEREESHDAIDLPGPSVAETKRPVESLPAAVGTAREMCKDAFSQLEALRTHLRYSWVEASKAFPEPEGWSQNYLGTVSTDKQEKLTHLHHSWLNKASEALTSVNEKCYFERAADAIATQDQYKDQRKLDYALDRVAHDGYARLTTGMLERWREAAGETLAGIDSVIGHISQRHDELQRIDVSERYFLLVGQHELAKDMPEEDEEVLGREWRTFFNEGQIPYVTADIIEGKVSSIASKLKRDLKDYRHPEDA